ncbi:MAG: type II toxin-antitoxin system VapC family toxin [Promethearchaeota archaeon]
MVFTDTDLVINYLRSRPKPLVLQAQRVMNTLFKEFGEVKITMITVGELYEGIYLSNNPARNLRFIKNFLKKSKIVPFSKECAIELVGFLQN